MPFPCRPCPRWFRLRGALLLALAGASCEFPRPTSPGDGEPAQLLLTPESDSLQPGGTVDLVAVGLTAEGDTADITVLWSATGGSVTDLGRSGGRHLGRYTNDTCGPYQVIATGRPSGRADTAEVTVVCPPPVASVDVTPSSATVEAGTTVQLTATPRDWNGAPLSGRVITWASQNTTVATVNGSGLVTGVAAGLVTITATVEGKAGTSTITVTAPPSPSGAVLVGAGDIANCSTSTDEATAKLLDSIPGTMFTAGDNAYPDGTASDFANCYEPTWGRHKARTRPSPGNHDYHTSGASAYFDYFGANAGPAGLGYYSYDVGEWHIISLNSNVSMSAGSAQEQWLRADLAANTKACVLAYWHHPRFSSGSNHGSSTAPRPLWQALYDFGAEVVVSGHDHTYERFAPQTPDGVADAERGIREFVVGTGGTGLYRFGTPVANSEVRYNGGHGVLKLTLAATSYTWEFVSVSGKTFTDSGSGSCH